MPPYDREARLLDRRECDDRVRGDAGGVRVRRRGRGRHLRRAGLRIDGRRPGAARRLDVPVRRTTADGWWEGELQRLQRRVPGTGRCAATNRPSTLAQAMTPPSVPLLDLVAQYASIKDDVLPAMMRVIEAQQFIMGPAVPQLEAEIARLSHAKHGVGCASGTDALLLPLKALNLQPGDEVITTPFTFFATAGTIHKARGPPGLLGLGPWGVKHRPPGGEGGPH